MSALFLVKRAIIILKEQDLIDFCLALFLHTITSY